MTHMVRISPRRWIYWGHETLYPGEKCGAVEQFFWTTDVPPYRLGNGWRMKETPFKAFHIGIAKKLDRSIVHRELEDLTPEEIGEHWNGPVQEEQV